MQFNNFSIIAISIITFSTILIFYYIKFKKNNNINNKNKMATTNAPLSANHEQVMYGAGCFWGTEKFFKREFRDALISTKVGYSGGETENPNYNSVCSGKTGHAEVLHIVYDNTKVNFTQLTEFFFRMHDPTTLNRQGGDKGTQYRSVIFFYSPQQQTEAISVRNSIQSRFDSPIVTQIVAASKFHNAEEYHQAYLDTNPTGYCNHRLRW
eukprot:TRINITY_DN374_c1_g2_i2.p2 TRINITY_DN374_c1_g2~~TRINITY_DN374_c1_g2_i2.p2  ORF type:complete len:210 (+),score=78.05 TRINITY_DN374_c1_g2_i2:1400-2029(+)